MVLDGTYTGTWRRLVGLAASLCTLFLAACSDSTGPGEINDRPGTPAWDIVSVGYSNSCALTEAGELHCWGFEVEGFCVFPGGCPLTPRPTAITGPAAPFDTIAGRGQYHCGITSTREAFCWGDFDGGSLGDGTTRQSLVPVRVAVDAPVRMVSTGTLHACVLTSDGVAYCWGNSDGGKLGLGDYDPVFLPTPMQVVTELRFKSISAGSTQTCAIAMDDRAYCWGGLYGTLGVGGELDDTCFEGEAYSCLTSGVPLPVAGEHRWSSITAGTRFTCGVTLDHRGYCWGAVPEYGGPHGEGYGVLGNGTLGGSKSPVPVSGNLEFRHIYAGLASACGLTLRGAAYCWGSNYWGTLGIGTHGHDGQGGDPAQDRSSVPVRVSGGLRFTSLSMWEQVCGVSSNNNLYCWGDNFGGKLGTAETDGEIVTVPTRVLPPDA